MKKLFCLIVSVLLFSCESKEKKVIKNTPVKVEEKEIMTELYGSWVGDFVVQERDTTRPVSEMYINKINISIKKITATEVVARSIVAGNNRPLTGKMTKTGNTIHFSLTEPGDEKNDGVFNFEIKNDTLLVGTWKANNLKKEVTKRSFELTKKEFKYNPNAMLPEHGIYVDYQNPKAAEVKSTTEEIEAEEGEEMDYDMDDSLYRVASESIMTLNSSTKKLKESDLKNLKKIDLEILRNTIFARHGLTFKTKTIRQFFDQVEWYIPVSSSVDNQLTAIEKENIAILKRFEKYATDNYDSFGR